MTCPGPPTGAPNFENSPKLRFYENRTTHAYIHSTWSDRMQEA